MNLWNSAWKQGVQGVFIRKGCRLSVNQSLETFICLGYIHPEECRISWDI